MGCVSTNVETGYRNSKHSGQEIFEKDAYCTTDASILASFPNALLQTHPVFVFT